ncbi:hypothetical protein VF14_29385 [Nostoc linckia z18]|uniref:Uncharacterized protein n=2 Tax=Nostoc linckia TaxID=92942 RepID=A0A9Q6EIA5_NOSLI|nr:hypothetical protein VF03_34580 [Nostoc linckia z2]PHJ65930.1 hypothetical protein VF02_08755 [Nostoc linckia z1]PHJ71786.1 hypothetical protein VF05_07275 [Nostoc linckia z3]PHJ77646.1 hypothetical protein VF07_35870 [Nostoc linckia z6]PHJ86988.1 hypothetical protein VF06_01375 [Nostoc linckia z4]PHJ90116.1 hypothetical protein VF04_31270 [Nostoc linckia z7]PHJ96914.1 hypothetical protein VF08_29690 [Nostoc linckia z8]PHK04868.1 hypothetical protein VF09_27725 [Nostoc linckia z9]PHK1573
MLSLWDWVLGIGKQALQAEGHRGKDLQQLLLCSPAPQPPVLNAQSPAFINLPCSGVLHLTCTFTKANKNVFGPAK